MWCTIVYMVVNFKVFWLYICKMKDLSLMSHRSGDIVPIFLLKDVIFFLALIGYFFDLHEPEWIEELLVRTLHHSWNFTTEIDINIIYTCRGFMDTIVMFVPNMCNTSKWVFYTDIIRFWLYTLVLLIPAFCLCISRRFYWKHSHIWGERNEKKSVF